MFRRAIRCVVPGNASSTEAESLEFKLRLACAAYFGCCRTALDQSHDSTLAMLLITFIAILLAREQKRSAFRISKLRRVMNPRQIQAAEAGISYATALAKIIGSGLQL